MCQPGNPWNMATLFFFSLLLLFKVIRGVRILGNIEYQSNNHILGVLTRFENEAFWTFLYSKQIEYIASHAGADVILCFIFFHDTCEYVPDLTCSSHNAISMWHKLSHWTTKLCSQPLRCKECGFVMSKGTTKANGGMVQISLTAKILFSF